MVKKAATKARRQVYAFIDTNIFLDFYRDSTEATLSLLERLEPVRERVISTYQVEMEFLKNRQRVIVDSLQKLKTQPPPTVPAIFADSATNKSLGELSRTATRKAELIRKRILRTLSHPSTSDVVYKSLEGIFQSTAPHVLTRDMPERSQVKRLAWRRFILGYPPRKNGDTSIGDALNWEWIVRCGQQLQGKILIVSRDSDYGVTLGGKCFLNDQLKREYRDRVGPKKSIAMTNRLSEALQELDVHVPAAEIEAETAAIASEAARTELPRTSAPRTKSVEELFEDLRKIWEPLAARQRGSQKD